ncbi:MAG: hypothetical protein IT373_14540, partial [Polyangiaceae bacterium]|nr:hypothetical protein [Polyangiaceae bacterium]
MPVTEPAASLGFIERIIDFSARNRVLMLVLSLALAALGVWCARRTPLDALPDLSDTQV